MRGFELRTDWLVAAAIEEVAAILSEPERLPGWWPEVYLSATVEDGVAAFHTRGWLPYSLRWRGRVVEDARPWRWAIEAEGDLAGLGIWTLEQRGDLAAVGYDWRVVVEKPLLRPLTPVLRPVYAWNHRWAMARGREGLERELVRRRAA
jgi:hypothetical protein